MTNPKNAHSNGSHRPIPWFGARKFARELNSELREIQQQHEATSEQLERIGAMSRELVTEVKVLRAQRNVLYQKLESLGGLSIMEIEDRKRELEKQVATEAKHFAQQKSDAKSVIDGLNKQIVDARRTIVATEDEALLQEVGVFKYRHPLTDAVAYERALERVSEQIKSMTRKVGGAVLATTNWTVN